MQFEQHQDAQRKVFNNMATKTLEQGTAALTTPAIDEVQQAYEAIEKAKENFASLQEEQRALQQRQIQLTMAEADEFYDIDRRLTEFVAKLHFANVALVQAKINLINARVARAKRILPGLQEKMNAAVVAVNVAQSKVNLIGMEMRPHQNAIRHSNVELGTLNRQLDRMKYEWQQRIVSANAPIVRDYRHRPRAS